MGFISLIFLRQEFTRSRVDISVGIPVVSATRLIEFSWPTTSRCPFGNPLIESNRMQGGTLASLRAISVIAPISRSQSAPSMCLSSPKSSTCWSHSLKSRYAIRSSRLAVQTVQAVQSLRSVQTRPLVLPGFAGEEGIGTDCWCSTKAHARAQAKLPIKRLEKSLLLQFCNQTVVHKVRCFYGRGCFYFR